MPVAIPPATYLPDFLAHWTGIHHNGTKAGFQAFQEVVRRLNAKYDHLVWMKLSEVARYWAARELTGIDVSGASAAFTAPYACPAFTVRLIGEGSGPVSLQRDGSRKPLREVRGALALESGTWTRDGAGLIACFDLPKGISTLTRGS